MAATLDNTADGTAGIVLERPCNSRPNHPTDVTAQSPAPACGTHAPGLAAEVAMKTSPEKSDSYASDRRSDQQLFFVRWPGWMTLAAPG
jgi:hypothetical protein